MIVWLGVFFWVNFYLRESGEQQKLTLEIYSCKIACILEVLIQDLNTPLNMWYCHVNLKIDASMPKMPFQANDKSMNEDLHLSMS